MNTQTEVIVEITPALETAQAPIPVPTVPPLSIAILQENLLAALTTLKPAVGDGKYIPILANVLVEATEVGITLTAIDLQTYIRVRVAGRVFQPGQVTIAFKNLCDFVKGCPPERIDIDDRPAHKSVFVSCGELSRSRIPTLPAIDFPAWPNEATPSCVVDAEQFAKAVVKIAPNALNDSKTARVILTTVNVRLNGNTLSLTASDGDRIAVRSLDVAGGVDDAIETNIDAKELKAVASKLSGSALLAIDAKGLTISTAHSDVFVRSVDGKYPEFSQYLDGVTITSTVQVAAPVLLSAVRRANVFARDNKETAMTVAVSSDCVFSVSAASQALGDSFETLTAAVVVGQSVTARIKARDAIKLLTGIGKQDVIVQFTANGKTVLFRAAEDVGTAYVLATIKDEETR